MAVFEKIRHLMPKSKSPFNEDQKSNSYSVGAPEIPHSRVTLVKRMGTGAFEETHQGELLDDTREATSTRVTVRKLKERVSDSAWKDFIREIEYFAELRHPNIICLLGVTTISKPMYMVFECLSKGDLHMYLRAHSPVHSTMTGEFTDKETFADYLSVKDLLNIASQIAAGMEYLASKCFVCKTLMTSSCFVGNGLLVKIAETEVIPERYYTHSEAILPIQWMPPEVVSNPGTRTTIEVNAWNFGVVLWEIHTYGKKPFLGLSLGEVVDRIKSNQLLECPDGCPSHVYHEIMMNCWRTTPSERPSFSVIHSQLKAFLDNWNP